MSLSEDDIDIDLEWAKQVILKLPEFTRENFNEGFVRIKIGYVFNGQQFLEKDSRSRESIQFITDWAKKEGFTVAEVSWKEELYSSSTYFYLVLEWVRGAYGSWDTDMQRRKEAEWYRRHPDY